MGIPYIEAKSLELIKKTYQSAVARIIFIDYDGTLIPFSSYPEQAVMNEKAKKIIATLTSDKKNKVIIISGRNREFLEQQFLKANVTLIAEHGFFIMEPGKEWLASLSVELDWKQNVKPILQKYVDRCKGSFMEEKFASLAWHYRNVDVNFVSLQINKLKDELIQILKTNENLQILEGSKVIEIKSITYNKGSIAAKLMQSNHYDFAMAIGDDVTDEDLFKAMPPYAHTIKIGTSLSIARYNLKRQKQLYELFQELAMS